MTGLFAEIDPRTKMFIVACLSTAGILVTDNVTLCVILLATLAFGLCFRAKPFTLMIRFRRLAFLVIAVAVIQSIFMPSGEVLIAIGPLPLMTVGGLGMAAGFLLRIMIVMSSAAVLTTSNYRDIIQGMVQLKLPYEIAFMASMGIRFLPMLREQFLETMTAIQLRGIDIQRIGFRDKLGTYMYLLSPVVISTMLKSRSITLSIESRGFRMFAVRTSHRTLKLKPVDWGIMMLALSATLIIILFT